MPSKYPLGRRCQRRFLQWIRGGKLVEALHLLAKHLPERSELHLDEAFVDAIFGSAKERPSLSAQPCAARAPRSSLSHLVTICLSAYLSKALRLPRGKLVEATLIGCFLVELPEKLISDKAFDSDALDRTRAEGKRGCLLSIINNSASLLMAMFSADRLAHLLVPGLVGKCDGQQLKIALGRFAWSSSQKACLVKLAPMKLVGVHSIEPRHDRHRLTGCQRTFHHPALLFRSPMAPRTSDGPKKARLNPCRWSAKFLIDSFSTVTPFD